MRRENTVSCGLFLFDLSEPEISKPALTSLSAQLVTPLGEISATWHILTREALPGSGEIC